MKLHLRIFPHRDDKPRYSVIDLDSHQHAVFGTDNKPQLKIWLDLNGLKVDSGYYRIFSHFENPRYTFAGIALKEITSS